MPVGGLIAARIGSTWLTSLKSIRLMSNFWASLRKFTPLGTELVSFAEETGMLIGAVAKLLDSVSFFSSVYLAI